MATLTNTNVYSNQAPSGVRSLLSNRLSFQMALPIAQMDITCLFFSLQGAGIFVRDTGIVTMINIKVYSNTARSVCMPSALD